MKLQLNHIQHYPIGENGLKMYDSHRKCIVILYGIRFLADGTIMVDVADDIDMPCRLMLNRELKWFKPILHDLSDLTKPIKVPDYNDGKEFVPMIELLTLLEQNQFHKEELLKNESKPEIISCKHNYYNLIDSHEYQVKYVVHTSNMGDLIYSFTYDPELTRFASRNETHSRPLGVGYQLDLFQLLYQWHFDLEGLIPAGLAIDIDTL